MCFGARESGGIEGEMLALQAKHLYFLPTTDVKTPGVWCAFVTPELDTGGSLGLTCQLTYVNWQVPAQTLS